MTEHELKSWVGLFEPILRGEKTHDLRVLDRDFAVGDTCLLREFEPVGRTYTGREVRVRITYITSARHTPCAFSPFALHPGMGVLSIRRLSDEAENAGPGSRGAEALPGHPGDQGPRVPAQDVGPGPGGPDQGDPEATG